MHPEPRALRPYLLLTTTFVIVGCVATYAVWHLAAARDEAGLPSAHDPADKGRVRAVDFLATTSPTDRARLTTLVDALTSELPPEVRTKSEADLLAFGAAAVPPLLTRLYARSTVPRGVPDEGLPAFAVLDHLLRALRDRLTPASPSPPFDPSPSRAWLDARAAAWFAWWDGYAAKGSG